MRLASLQYQGPFSPSALPPCVLEAVCPPAWLRSGDPGEDCPPCPEAPPCPSTPAVCPAVDLVPVATEEDPVGVFQSAVPGLLVALLLEAGRCARRWCGSARRRAEITTVVEDGVAPARRGAGVVEAFPDQPIKRPASAPSVRKNLVRSSGDSRRLRGLLRSKILGESDRVAHELRVLCDILSWAAMYDQVNLGGLTGLETALKQFATRNIKERQEAQSLFAFGKVPQRGLHEEEGAAVDGKGKPGRRLALMMGNEAVGALNWPAGYRNGPTPFDPDPMQARFWSGSASWPRGGAQALMLSVNAQPSAGCCEGAPRTMGRDSSPVSHPFRKGFVSLLETVEGCPPFEDVAFPGARRFLKEHPERVLRAGGPTSTATPYFDPAPKRSAETHRHFVADLWRRGFLRWTRPRCQVGLLFAENGDGAKLRVILDAMPAHELFEPPPGGVGPQGPGAQGLLQGYDLRLGLADAKCCFCGLRLPESLSEYFCLPERVNECRVQGVCPRLAESPLAGCGRPPVFGPTAQEGHFSHCAHVGNLGVASTSERRVSNAVGQLVRGFAAQVSGSSWKTRAAEQRFWLIGQALNGVLRRRRLAGCAVEVGRAQGRARFRDAVAYLLEAAPMAAGFWRGGSGEWRLAVAGDDAELGAAWGADPSYPEVPAAGLASSSWRAKQVQRWKFEGCIQIEEARALVMGARRIAQSVFGAACRRLILSDNMSVVLSFIRCRRCSGRRRRARSGRMQAPRRQKTLSAAWRPRDWKVRLSLTALPPAPRLPELGGDFQALPRGWRRQVAPGSDDDSGASDEQQVAQAGERREKGLQRRATKRRRTHGTEALLDSAAREGQTFLERRSVFAPARRRCGLDLDAFLVDEALVDYMNALFLGGRESAQGDRAMAGLMRRFPECSKQGEAKAPRAWRCRWGWRKLAPGRSRRAWPLALCRGQARRMVGRGALQMAVFLLSMVRGHFGPSHLLTLARGKFIAPAPGARRQWPLPLFSDSKPLRGKTGLAVAGVMLDSGWSQRAAPIFRELKNGAPEEKAWDFSYPQFLNLFALALEVLSVEQPSVRRRAHSGPSVDGARHCRSLEEIQKRGQRKRAISMQRCEKASRRGQSRSLLPSPLRDTLADCENRFEDVLLGKGAEAISL
ncbi:unnamed protein product [Prorocentrum cordatum]|uniref:Uncharacterized protein n=1 Tax=Prorocentrum cordatum TaxID=2364126 RepID=A0ABN9PKC3_9DINO|nr:unnamed protein product [Polarella glacialis]